MKLSIVITVNESNVDKIDSLLKVIQNQVQCNYEIILVNVGVQALKFEVCKELKYNSFKDLDFLELMLAMSGNYVWFIDPIDTLGATITKTDLFKFSDLVVFNYLDTAQYFNFSGLRFKKNKTIRIGKNEKSDSFLQLITSLYGNKWYKRKKMLKIAKQLDFLDGSQFNRLVLQCFKTLSYNKKPIYSYNSLFRQ